MCFCRAAGHAGRTAVRTRGVGSPASCKNGETVEVPDDSAVSVASEGLLGGNFIEIIPGGSVDVLESGGEIEDTQGSVSLLTLLMKFVAGGNE